MFLVVTVVVVVVASDLLMTVFEDEEELFAIAGPLLNDSNGEFFRPKGPSLSSSDDPCLHSAF